MVSRKTMIELGIKKGLFTRDETAMMSTGSIISLLISAVFVGALLPTIVTSLTDINTTGWGATETTLVALLPLFVVIGIIGRFNE